ncbi:response regulator [Motiliproteus coralliicola]|uniref:Response regulator n=1 Tax=Motiliproteus coralliicola TaxID=2283196 RepID=A0A369WX43_9GAMM|nr:response regulator [Motiliproteus coralliicola]RDE24085.1 response regulator [Motiliproteus coralliicola]
MLDYSKLRFLIIEDLAHFSSALRSMVMFYGVPHEHIQVAKDAEQALPLIKKTRYDVVLSDYNLGEGRNGNDILEEVKHHKLLKSACIYIMLTAENSTDMVMGALEYQPDEYLTKPFTKEVLNARLERLIARRDALLPIYTRIDKGQPLEAIKLCTELADQHPRYKGYLLKLRSELLMEQQAFDQCTEIYRSLLQNKFVPWAELGLGKCCYHRDDYSGAEEHFRKILNQNERYVQAYDWLARTQRAQGDNEAAQQTLVNGTEISPRNVRRQALLGELSMANGDMAVAEKAFNQSIKVGKTSVFRDPNHYFNLSKVIGERIKEADSRTAKRMRSKVTTLMDEVRSDYKRDPTVTVQAHLAESEFHLRLGEAEVSDKALQQAYEACIKEGSDVSNDIKEQLISTLQQTGKEDVADKLVQHMQREESIYNHEAVELYAQGEIGRALVLLKKARAEKPRSFAINLNFAQVALRQMKQNGVEPRLMVQVGQCFKQIAVLPQNDKRYPLSQQLKAMYHKMGGK